MEVDWNVLRNVRRCVTYVGSSDTSRSGAAKLLRNIYVTPGKLVQIVGHMLLAADFHFRLV